MGIATVNVHHFPRVLFVCFIKQLYNLMFLFNYISTTFPYDDDSENVTEEK